MLLLKAGKKGGGREEIKNEEKERGMQPLVPKSQSTIRTSRFMNSFPSLLPGHYAIIKGREEGRGGRNS